MDHYVKVAVRMRPRTPSEREEKATVHWKMKAPSCIYPVAYPSNVFTFSNAFTEKDDNEVIYSQFCSPIIQSVVKGYDGAIIAYGQMSSGKTFTMMGDDDLKIEGIIHFSIYDLFDLIENESNRVYLMRIACFEVHRGKFVRDLLCEGDGYLPTTGKLGRNPLLTRYVVQKPQDVFNFTKEAQKKRGLKCDCSGGFTLLIDLRIESCVSEITEEPTVATLSHLCFLDLSENCEDFDPDDIGSISDTKQELTMQPKKIAQHLANNRGKSQFIIHQGTSYINIYDNFLGGNYETAIICTVSPTNLHETYAYLEIASVARSVKNKPALIQTKSNKAIMVHYANQIAQLVMTMQDAEEKDHHQCRNLEKKIMRLQKFWYLHLLSGFFRREKISECSNELRRRKSLPRQPFIYRMCSYATYEPKKRV